MFKIILNKPKAWKMGAHAAASASVASQGEKVVSGHNNPKTKFQQTYAFLFAHPCVRPLVYSCMTPERIALLDQLGFSWEVRPSLERPRATWHQRLEELQTFHKKHGNFKVDVVAMPQLHAWCHEQKSRLKLLEKNNGKDLTKRMNEERVQALEGIGFTKDVELLESGTKSAALASSDDLAAADYAMAETEASTVVAGAVTTHLTMQMSHDPNLAPPATTPYIAVQDSAVNVEGDEWKDKRHSFEVPLENGPSTEDSFELGLI